MLSSPSGAAKLSLGVVIGLITLKVVVAAITGSISIMAQAADSLLDLFAVIIAFYAIRIAARPADEGHPFGHGKVEGIAAVVQGVLIFSAAGLIVYSSVRHIMTGTTLELAEAGIGVMAVSIIASIFLSRHLLRVSRTTGSVALEATAHNIAADVYSASGVLAGLAVVRFTGLNILDPIIAIAVALFIIKAACDVIRKSFGELIDVRLPQAEEDQIRSSVMERGCQMAGFHDLRTRKAGRQRYIDLHLAMPQSASVGEVHRMCDDLEQDIKNRLPYTSITIHVEPADIDCGQCSVSCTFRDKTS
ncbi:cation diffusion facilitator family transporter [Chloroflexota bacterium]